MCIRDRKYIMQITIFPSIFVGEKNAFRKRIFICLFLEVGGRVVHHRFSSVFDFKSNIWAYQVVREIKTFHLVYKLCLWSYCKLLGKQIWKDAENVQTLEFKKHFSGTHQHWWEINSRSQNFYCYQLFSCSGHPRGPKEHWVVELWGGVHEGHTWPTVY